MEYTGDVARGAWLAERVSESWEGIRHVTPAGFDAYVRVFHPFTRDRLPGHDWAEVERGIDNGESYDLETIVEDEVSWAATAAAFGTRMHAEAQSHRLVRRDYGGYDLRVDADGWRYHDPEEGRMPPGLFAELVAACTPHTDSARVTAGVWEGWSGLTSSAGYTRYAFVDAFESISPEDLDGADIQYVSLEGARMPRRYGGSFFSRLFRRWARPGIAPSWLLRRPAPGTGVLSREASTGPRLELPDRTYLLFDAEAVEFADPGWPAHAPWVRPGELACAQTPSLLWPEDRAWCIVSEIDFDTTIVACGRELAQELSRDPQMETAVITLDTDLTAWGDAENR